MSVETAAPESLVSGSLGPRFRCVLVADDSSTAYLGDASEHLGGNIRTIWVVAEKFSE